MRFGRLLAGFAAVLAALTPVRAQDSSSSAPASPPAIKLLDPVPVPSAPDPAGGPPRITPLEPVPVPPAPPPQLEMQIGKIEFELAPERPAAPKSGSKPSGPASRGPRLQFGEIEFEMPADSSWPSGTTVSHRGNTRTYNLPDGSKVIEMADGSATRLNPDGSPAAVPELKFGEAQFELPAEEQARQTLDRLKKNVRDVLKRQREANRSIQKALDKQGKDKQAAPPAKQWYAREIPGGSTEVGFLRSAALADQAVYQAPVVVPGDPVVAVRASAKTPEGETVDARGEVIVLDTDAVLTAKWTFSETLATTYNHTEQGNLGPTVSQGNKTQRFIGSGELRFEERNPYPQLSREEWEEMRAGLLSMTGRRTLMRAEVAGSASVSGSWNTTESGPERSSRSNTLYSGNSVPPEAPPPDQAVYYGVQLARDAKGWRIEEWPADYWRPAVEVSETTDWFQRKKEWAGWKTYSGTDTRRPQRTPLEIYRPTDQPDRNPSENTRVTRQGDPVLSPVGNDGRYEGRISFSFVHEWPSGGATTGSTIRTVTWSFVLETNDSTP
jgi:hypothetical protein